MADPPKKFELILIGKILPNGSQAVNIIGSYPNEILLIILIIWIFVMMNLGGGIGE